MHRWHGRPARAFVVVEFFARAGRPCHHEPRRRISTLATMSDTPLQLTAHIVGPTDGWAIEPASPRRDWMDETGGFAYRCLPLTIANQAGWIVRSPASFQAVWNGGPQIGDTAVLVNPEDQKFENQILSHFGW